MTTNNASQRHLLLFYWFSLLYTQQRKDDVESLFFDDVPHKIPSHIFIMAPAAGKKKGRKTPAPPEKDEDKDNDKDNDKGRKIGTPNYGIAETTHLLDIMERILPIGPDEWDRVVDEHDAVYPGRRSYDSIRRRFQNLHRKHAPTGSPNIPEDVRRARLIKYKIGRRADLGDGEANEYTLEEGYDGKAAPEIGREQTAYPPLPLQDDDPQDSVKQESVKQVVSNSTITPSKRTYNSRSSNVPTGEFFQAFQLQLQQDRQQWEIDREERREERRQAKETAEREFEERREERRLANKKSDEMMSMMMALVSNSHRSIAQPPKKRKVGLGSIADSSSK